MDRVYMTLFGTFTALLLALLTTNGRELNSYLGKVADSTTRRNGLDSVRRNKTILKIGLILPYSLYCGNYCPSPHPKEGNTYAAAFKIAVDHVNKEETLLPNHQIQWEYNDSRFLEHETIRAFYHQRERLNITALVGLGWFCHSISQIASGNNIPVISYVCGDDDSIMAHQESFESDWKNILLARTYPLTSQVIPNLVAILRHFKWNKIALIQNSQLNAFQFTSSLKIAENFRAFGVEIVQEETLPALSSINDKILKNVIEKVKEKSRIIVFMCDHLVTKEALMHAHKLGLTNGEYAFIAVIMSPVTFGNYITFPFKWYRSSFSKKKGTEVAVNEVFKTTLLVGPTINEEDARVKEFVQRLKSESAMPPYNSTYYNVRHPVPDAAYYLYDSVLIYAMAANKTLAMNGSLENGTEVYRNLKGTTFQSSLGHKLKVDERNNKGMYVRFKYGVYMAVKNGSKEVIQHKADFAEKTVQVTANRTDVVYVELDPVVWPKGVPVDTPPIEKYKVPDSNLIIWLSVSISLVVVVLVLLPVFKYRNYRLKRSLNSKLWEINLDDLEFVDRCPSPAISTANLENTEAEISLTPQRRKSFKVSATMAAYKTEWVAVKTIEGNHVDLRRETLLELRQMREIRHDNINHFIGAYVKPGRVFILTQFALRGSLEDVLEDNNIKLETLFLLSLIYDITKGMSYLHSTEFRSHGSLKSSNCVIDSRWVVKITDFGLHSLKSRKSTREFRDMLDNRSQLWMAPELLRDPDAPPQGTPKGDVYSFAIILQECHTRRGPWSDIDLSCEDIVSRVEIAEDPPFRPVVPSTITNAVGLQTMMEKCWNENPQDRPSFPELARTLVSMMKANGMKSDLVDNMVYMMEQYTSNLEGLVEEKNGQLSIEKKRIESLLERMLPRTVLKQLKRGKEVEAETFDEVTIYFSDIAGFTSLCAQSTAMQVVQFLNDLYTMFDSIISYYDVYKVETIGDAYMVVSGLPIRNGRQHAKEIGLMALHLRNAVKSFVIHHKRNTQLKIRIGIHSGSVVTGVVGSTMPRYCLFGDAVNTASRMESTGEALKVHISESTKEILDEIGGFEIRLRGDLAVKGIGMLTTYWLEDVGEEWLPTLTKYQDMESRKRIQVSPHNSPKVPPSQLRFAGTSPSNSLCPSPSISPTLIRKASRYRCRKEGNLELDISSRGISRANSKNTPLEEQEPLFPIA